MTGVPCRKCGSPNGTVTLDAGASFLCSQCALSLLQGSPPHAQPGQYITDPDAWFLLTSEQAKDILYYKPNEPKGMTPFTASKAKKLYDDWMKGFPKLWDFMKSFGSSDPLVGQSLTIRLPMGREPIVPDGWAEEFRLKEPRQPMRRPRKVFGPELAPRLALCSERNIILVAEWYEGDYRVLWAVTASALGMAVRTRTTVAYKAVAPHELRAQYRLMLADVVFRHTNPPSDAFEAWK